MKDTGEGGVRLRGLLGDSALYGLGSVADKAIGYFLLPITTALLSPPEYGLLNLYGSAQAVLFILVSLSLHQAVAVFHARAPADRRPAIFSAALAIAAALSILAGLATIPFRAWWGPTLFGIPAGWLVASMAPLAWLSCVRALGSARLRLDGRPWDFVVVTLATTMVTRAAALFLAWRGYGVDGWIVGECLGAAAGLWVLWPRALRDLPAAPEPGVLRSLAPFGLALTPSLLAHWAMAGADKFFMKELLADPLPWIGLYSVGERIAAIMHLANAAFVLGWQRFAYGNLGRRDGAARVSQGLTMYIALGGFAALGLSLLGDDLTRWMTRAQFHAGAAVIPALTCAAFLGGLAELIGASLQHAGRAGLYSTLTVAAAAAQMLSLVWLLPRYGYQSAAWASLGCQALKLAMVFAATARFAPLPWDFRRAGAVAAACGAAYLGAGWWFPASFPGQLACWLAAPAVLLAGGFLRPDERERLAAAVRRFRGAP